VILFRGKKAKTSERGIALIVALMMLALISAALMGMIMMSNTETNVSANFRDEQTAFFAAKAGIEEVRDRMRSGATNPLGGSSLPTALPGATNGVVYITNQASGETITPWLTTGTNYPDNEICKEVTTCTNGVPTGTWYATTQSASGSYAAAPILPWKWVRLTVKPNKTSLSTTPAASVDGHTDGSRVCWNSANEVVTASADCDANETVYGLTALAVTPSGSRRMLQMEVTRPLTLPIYASLFSKQNAVIGGSLNATGFTDQACSGLGIKDVYGVKSGQAVTSGGAGDISGNMTGSPSGSLSSTPFPYNVPGVMSRLSQGSQPINSPGTGVTGLGSPISSYIGATSVSPQVVLGTPPTVNYGAGGTITNPGSPLTLLAGGDVTLGNNAPAGSLKITGSGMLLVNGNLTIDITNGFEYFGLIVVTGNFTLKANPATPTQSLVHGAVVVGGTFDSTQVANIAGSFQVQQAACFFNNYKAPYQAIANRELMY
jgi:Tfp pilus assembly protein PilX